MRKLLPLLLLLSLPACATSGQNTSPLEPEVSVKPGINESFLAPDLDAVVLTPLASHSLALRPLVVPIADGLDLKVEGAAEDGACAVLDGQVPMRLNIGDKLCLRPAPVKFRHLSWGPDSFFRVFREKLGWSR